MHGNQSSSLTCVVTCPDDVYEVTVGGLRPARQMHVEPHRIRLLESHDRWHNKVACSHMSEVRTPGDGIGKRKRYLTLVSQRLGAELGIGSCI